MHIYKHYRIQSFIEHLDEWNGKNVDKIDVISI